MTLTRSLQRSWDARDQVSLDRSRAAFIEEEGAARGALRQADIDALPVVEWKGRRLRTVRCHGETGRGPHDVNVPESLLWALINIRAFRCP